MGKVIILMLIFIIFVLTLSKSADAIPAFARKYELSCETCHVAFPRLNSFGEQFAADNFRLDDWKETGTINTGDDRLALPDSAPIAFRAQAYMQAREGEEVDPITGPTGNESNFDFQSPYLIKLLAGAPLSDHLTFYFYAIYAEKGGNGDVVVEDAWFRHDDLFGTGIGMMLGQFQVSDLMFLRETRLNFQDFMVYRMAGITYDRGLLFDRDFGLFDLSIGAVNGNGVSANFDINSPGFRRPDNMFDNDSDKSIFGRVGTELGGVSAGFFGLTGDQKNATGTAGSDTGDRDTDKLILGFDLSGDYNEKIYWYFQGLWNRWDGFLDENREYDWFGGFAGVDYIHNDFWAFSLLYNFADANDFDGTGTVYEGIDINTITAGVSYYFMRNMKVVLEGNLDLIEKDNDTDFVGHESKESYVLLGFDAAF
ncbi:MAG TPA: hypothetical protein QF468_00940 [Nitrospinota bacterium]|nr:hypothetical protein [Nitrospinota bacterium]